MLATCIGSCGIALSLIPVLLATHQTHANLKEQIINSTYYCEVAYTLCVMTVCIWLIVKQNDLIQKGYIQFQNNSSVSDHENTHVLNAHKSRVYIVVFGIGGTMFLSCSVISRALQTQAWSLLYVCALLCFATYVPAIYRYHEARLKNRAIFHYGIAFLIGANVWSWILLTVYPLYEAPPQNSSAYNINTIGDAGDKFSAANSVYIFEILEGLFQPFFIEFLTISSGCLLCLWQTTRYGSRSMIRRSVNQRPSAEDFIDRNYNDILHSENEEAHLGPEQQRISEKCKIFIVTAFSVLVAGMYLIALQILCDGPFGKCADHLKISTCALYRKIIGSCVYFPLVIMNMVSLFKLLKDKTIISFESQLTSSGYLLLFTSGGYFMYSIWRLVANIGLLNFPVEQDLYKTALFTLFTVVVAAYYWIQTQHIMTVNYIHRAGGSIPTMSKLTMIYLSALNFADWMNLSLTHKWVEFGYDPTLLSPEISIFFGYFESNIIFLLFQPVVEMYMFHSAMMACECLHDSSPSSTT